MRVVLDAMGSDNAPEPEVRGAVEASLSPDVSEVVLVGDQARLESALKAYPERGTISIVHASEVITMDDSPAMGVRKKKDASLLVGLRMVKRGEADAFVTAGNTGALYVAARTVLGPIKGVARSAICQQLPTLKDPVAMLDLGANVDCTARHLCEFAEMGMLYSKLGLGVDNPRVGLMNIGEEQAKGNEATKTAYRMLSAADSINFVGNIEPKALFSGDADVVVCDGFVGNIVLKTGEAAAGLMMQLLKNEIESSLLTKLGAALCIPAFNRLRKMRDSNEYPGAPLLGVNGVVLKCHGAATYKGIANGIHGAARTAASGLTERIREEIGSMRNLEADLVAQNGNIG